MFGIGLFQAPGSQPDQTSNSGSQPLNRASAATTTTGPSNASSAFFTFNGSFDDKDLRSISCDFALTGEPFIVLSDAIEHQEEEARTGIERPFKHEERRLSESKSIIVRNMENLSGRIAAAEDRISKLADDLRRDKVE